ncbi:MULTISPECIES: sulfatase-like hydrolase/transferase [Mesorhizobium]|uniref:Sulfatase N-terminal domain-containing protein n=1 Tax=Mesorhizobium qingshengii TaxID=1165689 RepID=A0A1G5ZWU7_9HYPH|nr:MULTISPECIES: sulfatase-like hydrolase/transferase [Mesorhizobium]MCH4561008.1 hypothetical protein [Mesorhizobium jarvisii]SDA99258.1 hypothetical protein SAMN02927914_06511 [Mesorhizobium qingshengii]
MVNHIVWIIFDSARYDCFEAAHTPAIDRIGPAQKRYSYASWTAPSHHTFLMGLPPHANEPGVLSSDAQRRDLSLWQARIGGNREDAITFADFAPTLSLPLFLRSLGYRTEAYVSMPVLNPKTLIAPHFDIFELMPVHNDLRAIIGRLNFDGGPHFMFINAGETHYPYSLPGENAGDLPHIPGVHGLWRGMDEFVREPQASSGEGAADRFDVDRLRPLWNKQVQCIEYLDGVIGELIEIAPPDTWFMVTSDHGELFGEGGYFGHGPVMHEKVFEVFFVEGRNPRRGGGQIGRDELEATVLGRLKQLGYL